jgi:diguanylate cyclase (GGDEF)-like protein
MLLLSLALADRINLLKTETEQANQKLHESENRLKQFLEALPVGVVVFQTNKLLSYINERAYELFHLTPTVQNINTSFAETLIKLPRYVAQTNQPYPLEKLPLSQAFQGHSSYIDDLEMGAGPRHQLEIWGKPIFDTAGQVEYAMLVFQDITRRKQNEAELYHYQHRLEELVAARTAELNRVNAELDRLAHVDGLTQIANRRRFDQYLSQAWQKMAEAQLPLSLILCDIDYFKLYNDTYGHQAGDDCLRQVAQAFTTSIKRSTDLAARYGGEEFVLVLPRTDEAGVKIVAGYLHERIQQLQIPHAASKCSQYITISLGISTIIPALNQSPDILITTADASLYQAKLQGRNRTISQAVGN